MKTKRIAIFYAGAKHWGGIETYIEQIFRNADPKKIDLTLVGLGSWELGDKLKEAGFQVRVINNKWYNPQTTGQLADLLKSGNFDLITSQGLVANFYGRLAAKQANIPNLVTIHSDYKWDYEGVKEFLFWLTFKCMKSMTSRYVVVSNFLKEETMKLGVAENKISLVYNGVKEIPPQPKKRGKTVIFGSLGRLHYKKGYHVLIEAVNLIKDLDFKVYVWGSGEEKENLENLINKYGLREKFILKGFTKDISKALAETDIYIQPSLEEGFGITVVEAMYAEKTVIVAPSGSLPELIKDEETGLIAPAATPEALAVEMKAALEEKDSLMGKRARKDVLSRFTIDKWISEIERVYMEASK